MNILPQQLNALDILNIFIEEHRICNPLDVEACTHCYWDGSSSLYMNSIGETKKR